MVRTAVAEDDEWGPSSEAARRLARVVDAAMAPTAQRMREVVARSEPMRHLAAQASEAALPAVEQLARSEPMRRAAAQAAEVVRPAVEALARQELGSSARIAESLRSVQLTQTQQHQLAILRAIQPAALKLPRVQALGQSLQAPGGWAQYASSTRRLLFDVLANVPSSAQSASDVDHGVDAQTLSVAREVVEGLDEPTAERAELESSDVQLDEQDMRPVVETVAGAYAGQQRALRRAAVVGYAYVLVLLLSAQLVAEHYDEAQALAILVSYSCNGLALRAAREAGRAFDFLYPAEEG